MRRSYLPPLLLLSAIWGSSYMFIKVGVRDFAPVAMVDVRLFLAAAVLLGYLAARGSLGGLRAALAPGAVIGLTGLAIPFFLISWGETHIDSGVAGVATASVPIFVALIALRYAPTERSRGLRLVGLPMAV